MKNNGSLNIFKKLKMLNISKFSDIKKKHENFVMFYNYENYDFFLIILNILKVIYIQYIQIFLDFYKKLKIQDILN